MDCTVHGILQARILEWVAIPFSRGSSRPRDRYSGVEKHKDATGRELSEQENLDPPLEIPLKTWTCQREGQGLRQKEESWGAGRQGPRTQKRDADS